VQNVDKPRNSQAHGGDAEYATNLAVPFVNSSFAAAHCLILISLSFVGFLYNDGSLMAPSFLKARGSLVGTGFLQTIGSLTPFGFLANRGSL
jgi:hypothetical protein